jgi:hypothetical protein
MSKMRRENSSPGYRRMLARMREDQYDDMVADTLRRQQAALEKAHDEVVAKEATTTRGSTRRHLP